MALCGQAQQPHQDARLTVAANRQPQSKERRILVCGPSKVGKSTFSRSLVNSMLTTRDSISNKPCFRHGVLLLDLDFSEPELAPHGIVYLAHVRAPLLGPPFSHLVIPGLKQNCIQRMHYLCDITTDSILDWCLKCISDLLKSSDALQSVYHSCPLVINTSSWLFGLEPPRLSLLLSKMHLSDVVYLGGPASSKYKKALNSLVQGNGCQIREVESRFLQPPISSSDIQRHHLQSYFHIVDVKFDRPIWNPLATLSRYRKRFTYGGLNPMVWAICTIGERLASENLSCALEGSIVAIMRVDGESTFMTASNEGLQLVESNLLDVSEVVEGSPPETLPRICRTSVENLPYLRLNDHTANPLWPESSECLGLGYVVHIDSINEGLEMLTPVPSILLSDTANLGHKIVILLNKQDGKWTPNYNG